MDRIVVGIDGSENSNEALKWAASEAVLRKASLEVVNVYSSPQQSGTFNFAEALEPGQRQRIHDKAEAAAHRLVEEAIDRARKYPGADAAVRVSGYTVMDENPAKALIEWSMNAQLLVVSSRGRGRFAGILLGSVSQQCAIHAHSPVVIVRTLEGDREA